ncbi:MAG: D-alanyl-D-alanine carboxypeptidase/D-alanyl-D-alanine-endopeptidase [Bacteroidales bacterium]|nr:D-alanyl-D-alanine carboxypeptidase/D-alanyl-D-alanine-endopeptidase [Bacteroidales bacterium]
MSLISSLVIIHFSCSQPEKSNKETADTAKDSVLSDTVIIENLPDSFFILLENLKTDSNLHHASLSYIFYNLTKDTIISSHNPELSLMPASTLKLLTTAAALEILGPNTRFRTRLAYDGSITGKTLTGNIYIIGGGDPTLGSEVYNRFFINEWVNAIDSLKIDTLDGHIIADPSIFTIDAIPYTWPVGVSNASYAAAAHGLSAYDNTFSIKITERDKGFITTGTRNMVPFIKGQLIFCNYGISNDETENLFISSVESKNIRVIKGAYPRNTPALTIKSSISDPASLVAQQVFEKLTEKGKYITGKAINIFDADSIKPVKEELENIYTSYSPPVASIVQNVNTYSNNMFAEHLIKHISLKKYGIGETESGCRAVKNFFKDKGMDVSGLFMYDGSGLSRYNAVTAQFLLDVLIYMRNSDVFNLYYHSLARSGISGTLRNFCLNTAAQDKIVAKSGTMDRVKSLAGFAHAQNGDTLAFAIIVNNFICDPREITPKFEEIVKHLILMDTLKTN